MTDGLEAARREVRGAIIRYPGAIPAGALVKLEKAVREDERASESALRAAAREVVESQESLYGPCEPGCECSIPALKAALDGAPWEPSEEQVERAAEAGWRAIDTDDDWALIEEKNRAPWRIFARAALKAALGLESGSAG